MSKLHTDLLNVGNWVSKLHTYLLNVGYWVSKLHTVLIMFGYWVSNVHTVLLNVGNWASSVNIDLLLLSAVGCLTCGYCDILTATFRTVHLLAVRALPQYFKP